MIGGYIDILLAYFFSNYNKFTHSYRSAYNIHYSFMETFVLMIAIAFGYTLYVEIKAYSIHNFQSTLQIKTLLCSLLSVAAASDFILALAVWYYLYKYKQLINFSNTSTIIFNLMCLIIISGLATSILYGLIHLYM
ncbi:hypothetical protein EDD18DRAFT_1097765 [Armillaria luteobubalina]|uniref:Uncharacterized protein n=1 Tax=Armillaria luteobubalina TaxID=153913 RepID=A0AA39QRN2_9AGAR|nr:hypothetical protein EDD18DRAFT_1097765 [Armillaria luteobubalina]